MAADYTKKPYYVTIGGMQVLGIYIDGPFLRLALVEKTRKKREILYLKSFLCSETDSVKQLYNLHSRRMLVSALPAKHLLMRPLNVKLGKHQHLEQVISFQSDATSHFRPEDVVSVPFIVNTSANQTNSLLFTTPKDALQRHLSLLDKCCLEPDLVGAAPLALVNYAEWKMPHLRSAFLVDLGSEEWTCVFFENGELKKCHSIGGGIESLLSALWEDRKKTLFQKEIAGVAKQIDLMQLQTPLNQHLSKQLSHMRQELSRSIYSFFRSFGQKPIFFTGRTLSFGQLRQYLLEPIKEWVMFETETPKEESPYAIPIGLVIGKNRSPQFLRGEFFPQKNWKKAGIYAAGLLFVSLGFALLTCGFAHTIASSKTKAMASYLREFLNNEDPISTEKIFKSEEIDDILHRWSQAVNLYSKNCPYVLNTPKISEILSWLYQNPTLTDLRLGEDPIEIQNIHYNLVSYPHIGFTKEPYTAKMELEFTTKSALNARKFHDFLLQFPGPLDETQEIEWEALDQVYRVSFFIKENPPCF